MFPWIICCTCPGSLCTGETNMACSIHTQHKEHPALMLLNLAFRLETLRDPLAPQEIKKHHCLIFPTYVSPSIYTEKQNGTGCWYNYTFTQQISRTESPPPSYFYPYYLVNWIQRSNSYPSFTATILSWFFFCHLFKGQFSQLAETRDIAFIGLHHDRLQVTMSTHSFTQHTLLEGRSAGASTPECHSWRESVATSYPNSVLLRGPAASSAFKKR